MPAPEDNTRKRKGQTLAEFAITLPILLVLVFGVIEFGRVFQAWVTLQNAARTAARYASTGSYNEARWPLIDDGRNDPDSVVPCVFDDEFGDTRGVRNTDFRPNGPGTLPQVQRYERTAGDDSGDESLFATWWDGRSCEPNLPEDQNARKDIVRILSIMEEARRGAAGLALGPDILEGVNTVDDVKDVLYSVWERPIAGNTKMDGWETPAWFNVMVCSSRQRQGENSTLADPSSPTRFRTIVDEGAGVAGDQYAPVCLMNEEPNLSDFPDATWNPGVPWLDPGNAGDSVTIVVTFNHPLITPLGLAPFVRLQARRTAVNEAFRVVDARSALLGGGRVGDELNRPPTADAGNDRSLLTNPAEPNPNEVVTVLDGSDSFDSDGNIVRYTWIDQSNPETPIYSGANPTFSVSLPPGVYIFKLIVEDDGNPDPVLTDEDTVRVEVRAPDPTATPTSTVTATATSSPIPPFSCDLLSVGELSFFGNRVFIEFRNDNVMDSVLTRADLHWRKPALYPDIFVSSMAMDSNIIWAGQDSDPSTDTNADPSTPPDIFINAERILPGLNAVVYEAVFANGPNSLADAMSIYDFAGTVFYFSDPERPGEVCAKPLNLPTPTPSPTFDPIQPTNTATFTPDCASDGITVRLTEFRNFGVVKLEVVNLWQTVAVMTDFEINWIQRAPGIMTLDRITVGGNGAADTITPTVRVWEAPTGQDANPPTVRGDGTWLTNYTFPANSITPLYLDFGGTTTTIQSSFGVQLSDFNGTWFEIYCGQAGPGDGGGGGPGPSGRIPLFEENTPVPTNTPGPTNTPRPTYTPSRTFTPGPPTNTPRPPTITNTPAPTNTRPPTEQPTNTPWPTQPGGGGSDG